MLVTILLSLISTAFAFLIFYISFLDKTIQEPSKYPFPFNYELLASKYPNVCENKLEIILGIFILLFLVHIIIYNVYKSESKISRRWLKRFLQHIIDQDLGGGEYETRITIFCKKKGWRFVLPYCWNYLFTNKFILAWKNRPRLFVDYLVIYERFSFPKSDKSYTFFQICSASNPKSSSIVADCYKRGVSKCIVTSYISDIELPDDISLLSNTDKDKVYEYISKTGTKYDKLRMLNRRANYIYAVPIRYNQEIWGVIVFDNNHETNNVDIKEELKNHIDNYQKIVQFTIQLFS